jgi:hypothetical protein
MKSWTTIKLVLPFVRTLTGRGLLPRRYASTFFMTVIILDYCPWKVTHTVILADAHLQHLSILRRYSEFTKDEVDDLFVENQDGYTAFYL